ncbi:MAG: hypothetical protein R2854_20845 [Caldilineaceae bacterium]
MDDSGAWSLTTALDTAGLYAVSLQASNVAGDVVATATAVTLEVAAPTAAEAVAAAPTTAPTATETQSASCRRHTAGSSLCRALRR